MTSYSYIFSKLAPQLPHPKIVLEAQQLLDDKEYEKKTSKFYGHVHTVASPLWKSGSPDLM